MGVEAVVVRPRAAPMSAEPRAAVTPPGPVPVEADGQPDAAFGLHVALSVVAGAAATATWAATSGDYFWPRWVWLGLAISVAVHLLVRWAALTPSRPGKAYRVTMASLAALAVVDVLVWLLAGAGTFYPRWSLTGYAVVAATLSAIVHRRRLPWASSSELVERVDVLTRTRSGALDVQAHQLRRIERDLHDGAQVRLVALTMQLGRAEARLEDSGDEATLALVRRARDEASAAIGELRDLARGIAPPVLADRGLAAAADALGRRSASPVEVDAVLGARAAPVVESAAYFVIAEALTNASKHVPGAAVRVTLREEDGALVVLVADDGPGGADPAGSGLTGLRHRVEALDGRLLVTSAAGTGTTVRAELPCAS
ncbi:sensor histidine kinase [Patulibacter sp.]|uniref:sensor histidine kinase n=1 Tax=Patulibacter sp. TaxID=1912859 RepID=UPI00271B8622|nr:histidine kinase [Patulibacter sp.]MDO9410640.1 histidine kinase [Patulibacter sp.]